ncbi:MAG: dodecin family protein [Anaerofustis sp.]
MSVVKVIEIVAESDHSWEAAAQEAVREASLSVQDIRNVEISNFQATVENGRIACYRVDAKVSFTVHDHEPRGTQRSKVGADHQFILK